MKKLKFFAVVLPLLCFATIGRAQNPVTVKATPVKGEAKAYVLTISNLSEVTVQNALNGLSGNGDRAMFSSVNIDPVAGKARVVLTQSQMGAQDLEVYLSGYLSYKVKESSGGKAKTSETR